MKLLQKNGLADKSYLTANLIWLTDISDLINNKIDKDCASPYAYFNLHISLLIHNSHMCLLNPN